VTLPVFRSLNFSWNQPILRQIPKGVRHGATGRAAVLLTDNARKQRQICHGFGSRRVSNITFDRPARILRACAPTHIPRQRGRPHQALGGAYPGELYTPSARVYEPPALPDYPFHDRAIRVTSCGHIRIGRRKINLSIVCAGQTVGVTEVEDQIWMVSFLDYDLGYFDMEKGRMEPAPNPFVPDRVLTICPE
jgi:putative transposase